MPELSSHLVLKPIVVMFFVTKSSKSRLSFSVDIDVKVLKVANVAWGI